MRASRTSAMSALVRRSPERKAMIGVAYRRPDVRPTWWTSASGGSLRAIGRATGFASHRFIRASRLGKGISTSIVRGKGCHPTTLAQEGDGVLRKCSDPIATCR